MRYTNWRIYRLVKGDHTVNFMELLDTDGHRPFCVATKAGEYSRMETEQARALWQKLVQDGYKRIR